MTTPGPGDLYAAAQEYLGAVAAALETTVGGQIPYQVIWQGRPPWDCVPALFVHCGGPSVADTYPLQPPLQPMQRMVTSGQVNIVQFTATVLRCAPVPTQKLQTLQLPQPAEVEAVTQQAYEDVWAVWNYCLTLHRPPPAGPGTLFQSPSGRREMAFDPAVPVLTSGGACGWEIPLKVQLGGYRPVVGS